MAYLDIYGALYSDDRKALLRCPLELQGTFMIPEGVTKISGNFWYDKRGYNEGAFENCKFIETIIIPASVEKIEDGAFSGTQSLKQIYVDGKNNSFCSNNGILYNKEKTELLWCPEQYVGSLHLDNTVKAINNSIGNSMVDAICLAEGSEYYTIIDGILYDKNRTKLLVCPRFKYGVVNIPTGIKAIESRAFKNCLALKTVVIPDSVQKIGYEAFSNCTALTNVKLPNAQTKIGPYCFAYCTALSEIVIPPNVYFEEVGGPLEVELYGTFLNCTGLSKITFMEGREKINGDCADHCIFENCTSIRTISFPKSLKNLHVHCWGESISEVLVPIGEKKRYLQMLNDNEESIRKHFRNRIITEEGERFLRTIQKYKDSIEDVK